MEVFSTKITLPVALALAAFAILGSKPALAQSATANGSVLPWHYDASGGRAPGWSPEGVSVEQFAHAPTIDNNGYDAYAQAPATNHHPGAQSSRSGSTQIHDRFSVESQR